MTMVRVKEMSVCRERWLGGEDVTGQNIYTGEGVKTGTHEPTHMHTYIHTHTLSMYRVKSGKNKEERKMGCYPDQAEKSGLGKKTVIKK
jgi:hypothetical protein